jgi:PadR family transcriptional regulator PadR
MGKGFLSLATATILNAVANGYSFGFDIVDITGMPGGTVYPALRRLEEAGYLTSEWEKERVAQAELRPRRKYYEITRNGRQALADAIKRYRVLEQAQLTRVRDPKSSRA